MFSDMASISDAASASKLTNKKSNYYCCVPMCNSNGRLDQTISFHHIPQDQELKKKWILKIRRDEGPEIQISKSTVVCSKYFTKEEYTGWGPVRKRLKRDAVPSIFEWKAGKAPRRTLKRNIPLLDEEVKAKRHKDSEDETPNVEVMQVFSAVPLTTSYEQEIKELKEELKQKSLKIESLNKQLVMEKFVVKRFSNDDKMIQFFTGFISYDFFLSFFKLIEPTARNMQSKYYEVSETVNLSGRKRNMLLIDEFFMFLCRFLEQDLSIRFKCDVSSVSRKILTWVNFLYVVLGRIPIWLPRNIIDELMPECFKTLYPKTRVIIDCTEIKTQQPSSLVLNSQLYSNYKSVCTFKCLLGIASHGAISFISSLFTGCMSDVEITKLSGLVDLLEPGDDVMADKGFTLRNVFSQKGVSLNIPPFFKFKT